MSNKGYWTYTNQNNVRPTNLMQIPPPNTIDLHKTISGMSGVD